MRQVAETPALRHTGKMRRWRTAKYLYLLLTINGAWLRAQTAEPILTKSAVPFAPDAGAIKLEYAGGLGPSGGSTQAIPEATLEEGILNGLELQSSGGSAGSAGAISTGGPPVVMIAEEDTFTF